MRSIPGVIVSKGTAFSLFALQYNQEPMHVYIDGILVEPLDIPEEPGSNSKYKEPLSPLNMVPALSIKAIEVYSHSVDAPMQYGRTRFGGTILIWTGR